MTQATLSLSTAKPESSQKPAHLANTFQDKLYFLYGTLMNPSTQALVLKHPGRPEHHSTYIAGHPINSGASTRPSWMRSQTRRFAGLSTESGRGSKKTGLHSMRWMFKGWRIVLCILEMGRGLLELRLCGMGICRCLGSFYMKDWVLEKRKLSILGGWCYSLTLQTPLHGKSVYRWLTSQVIRLFRPLPAKTSSDTG